MILGAITLNSDDLQRKIARVLLDIKKGVLLGAIGARHLYWVNQNFRTEGRGPGAVAPWKPMAPSTRAARRKGGKGAKLLRDTGRMAQSFAPQVRERDNEVEVGTSVTYAKYHHAGTDPYIIRPKGRKPLRFMSASGHYVSARQVNHPGLPARPLLPTKAQGEKDAAETVEAVWAKVLKDAQAGGRV